MVVEPIEWLFGNQSERQAQNAARSLAMFTGALIGILAGCATHADLIALRSIVRSGGALSISTLLVATSVNAAVLSFFLAVGSYCGFFIGEIIDHHASPRYQRTIYYVNRSMCLALCIGGIAWAVNTTYEGNFPAMVCVPAAGLFLVVGVRIIKPLREALSTKFGLCWRSTARIRV